MPLLVFWFCRSCRFNLSLRQPARAKPSPATLSDEGLSLHCAQPTHLCLYLKGCVCGCLMISVRARFDGLNSGQLFDDLSSGQEFDKQMRTLVLTLTKTATEETNCICVCLFLYPTNLPTEKYSHRCSGVFKSKRCLTNNLRRDERVARSVR